MAIPMTVVFTQTQKPITLVQELSSGGEGVIWTTDLPGRIAKIYKSPTQAHLNKISLMVQSPPAIPRDSIAWPQDMLFTKGGNFVGFLMSHLEGRLSLNNIYNSKFRKQKAPHFDWQLLHITALNIASIVGALHSKGYVLGDLKTDHFLVDDQAQVSLVDVDSIQVKTPREIFRCPVGSEGFTPPELVGKDLLKITRFEEQDRFGLAVLLYMVLMGTHPYAGSWRDGHEPLARDDAVAGGFWPYGASSVITLSPLALPLEILSPGLQEGFLQTFNTGHHAPEKRLKPAEWQNRIEEARARLMKCPIQSSHLYDQGHRRCYWCTRREQLGVDAFPLDPAQPKPVVIPAAIPAPIPVAPKAPAPRPKPKPKVESPLKIEPNQEHLVLQQKFRALLQQEPMDDQALLRLWDQHPDFHTAADALLHQQVRDAQARSQLHKDLSWALKHGTLKEMADIWDNALSIDHPRFDPFRPKIGFAHGLHRRWQQMRKTILEGAQEEILDLWDESLTPFALEYGLEKTIHQAFLEEMAYRTVFPLRVRPQLFSHRDYWQLTFPWPYLLWAQNKALPAPYTLIALGKTHGPTAPDQVTSGLHHLCVRYKGSNLGEARIPKTMANPHISLWAAYPLCGKMVVVGERLSLTEKTMQPRLLYSVEKMKNKIIVTLETTQEMTVPRLKVQGVLGRQPLAFDRDAIPLDTLEQMELPAGIHKIELPITEDYQPGLFLRLDPEDPEILETLTLLPKGILCLS